MSFILGQYMLAAVAAGSMLYFMATYDTPEKKGKEKSSLERMASQVSYRDPKLIEEHKKKLEEQNNRTNRKSQ